MPLMIYRWQGSYLRRAAFPDVNGNPGWALAQACCCLGDCCGRTVPGPPPYDVGPLYYPTTMHGRVSGLGSCICPPSPVEFDLQWDGDKWYKDLLETANDCPSFSYDITDIWLQCVSSGLWRAHFVWGPFEDGCDEQLFDVAAELNEDGECDPFIGEATLEINTLYCCGFMTPPVSGKQLKWEFWE